MQLVLRMERADPPSWHRALAAAATGAAALCADPRSEPGGEWYDAIADYCRGHIRKVTRRARGAHWVAAQELPGITIDIDGTQVRALVPGLVSELDPRISRLQVGGTDVPHRTSRRSPAPTDGGGAARLARRRHPSMTLGKAMAQAGHAGMIAVALLAEAISRRAGRVDRGTAARQSPGGRPPSEWAGLTARSADPARVRRDRDCWPSGTPGSPRSSPAPSPSSPRRRDSTAERRAAPAHSCTSQSTPYGCSHTLPSGPG